MRRERTWAAIGVGVLVVMAVTSKARAKTVGGSKGRPYRVTPDDKLWLLRAVEQEGAPRDQVARTLVNLFVYLLNTQGATGASKDLTTLVRCYASPVNPLWYPSGAKHVLYVAKLRKQGLTVKIEQENEAAKLRQTVHSTQTKFSPKTIDAVNNALSMGWTSDWTDYAAPHVDASKRYERRTESVQGKNTFWSRAPKWPGYTLIDGALVRA